MKRKFFRSLAIACSIAMLVQTFPMVTLAQTEPTIPATVTESGSKTLLPIGSDTNEEITTDIAANEAGESPIVGEDTTRRTSNEKHFRKADGSFVQISYDEPIHYEKDGKWEEIDNTLIEKQRTDGSKYLTNKASDVDVELPTSSGTKNPVKISHNGYTLSWNLKNQLAVSPDIKQPAELEREELSQQKAASTVSTQSMLSKQQRIIQENEEKVQLKNKHSAAIYPDMLPGTDIQYDVQSNGVKESIVLDKLPSDKSYTFRMEAADMSAVLEKDNSVAFYAKGKSEPEFIIKAPYMFDDNNCISEKISVSLKQTSTGWDYTITPDRAWLSDDTRKYPVTIDPTVQSYSSSDSLVKMYSVTNKPSYETSSITTGCPVGSYQEIPLDDASYIYRTYIKISNSAICKSTRRILRAELYLAYNRTYGDTNNLRVDMHQMTGAWVDNAGWSNKPGYGNLIDYTFTNTSLEGHYFNFTSLVYGWITGGYQTDCGLVLKAHTESGDNNRIGYSNDYLDKKIWICYRDIQGIEDYWQYTSMDSGYDGTTMVNTFSGHVVSVQPLASADGNNMPVSINLVYNPYYSSADAYGNLYNNIKPTSKETFTGEGWRTNYQMKVRACESPSQKNTYPYIYTDADGTDHYFYYKNGKTTDPIVDEDGLGYTLTKGSGNTTYTITDKQGGKMTFNSNGLLSSIINTNNQKVTIQYGSGDYAKRIASITDGSGRKFTFKYENANNAYALTSIVKPSNKENAKLFYSGNKLSKVFYKTKYIYYSYASFSGGSTLSTIRVASMRETMILYSYGSKGQTGYAPLRDMVVALQNIACGNAAAPPIELEYQDNSLNVLNAEDLLERYDFSYQINQTTVKDKANRSTIYQFNNFGQTTSVQDVSSGTSMFYEHGAPGTTNTSGTQNKLLTSSKSQIVYNNYLKNHGFDSNTSDWTIFTNKSGQTYQAAHDTSKGHSGKGSLKVVQQSGTPGLVWCSQDVTAIGTATYTASCYINTGGTTLSGSEGAVLYIEVTEKDNVSKVLRSAQSSAVKKTATNEWQRLEVSVPFTYGERLRIFTGVRDGSVGSFWLDDFQLEKSETTNTYNLLEDSYMKNGWASWTTSVSGKFREGSGYATVPSLIGFPGSETAKRSIYQDVKVNGVKGDVFALGGYGKALGLPPDHSAGGSSNKPTFRLELEFYNGTTKLASQKPYYVDCNPYGREWQYVAGRIIAPGTYDRVRVQLRYDYNANNVQFKAVYLNKEEFGQTYVYDKDGNVTSTKDLANSQSSFEYRNDQLSKILNPTGSRYMYTYNRDTKNMEFAIDTDTGVLYRVSYDAKGNPTTAKTAGMKRATSLSTAKTYMLINAFSGNSVDNSGNSDGGSVKNWRFHISNENQYWKLGSTSESGVYTFQRADNSSLVMTVENGSTANNANIKLKTYANQDAQKFKITANGDGTYRILTKVSSYAKCIDSQPGSTHDTKDGVALQQYTYTANDEAQKWYLMEFDHQNSSQCTLYSESKATYTSDGNFMASQTDARGKTARYAYDSSTGQLTSATDPKGTVTQYRYHADSDELLGVQVKAAGSDTTLASVQYTHNVVTHQLTNINNYVLHYDKVRRPTGVSVGERRLSTLTYNTHNMVGKMLYGNDALTVYWHDSLDRTTHLRKQSSSNGSTGTIFDYYYSYNNNGLLGLKKDLVSNTRTRYTYDTAGRLMQLRTTSGANADGGAQKYAETYGYESKTNRLKNYTMTFGASETYAGSYRYGTASSGQIAEAVYGVTFAGVERYRHTYDALGRKSSDIINTGSKTIPATYTYLAGSGTNSTTAMLSTITVNGVTWKYEYDDNGNITKIYKNNVLDKEYTYDVLNQLTKEVDKATGTTTTYTYDKQGNLTSAGNHTYTYGDSKGWSDLLTTYDGSGIAYDNIGNPTIYRDFSMTWQNGRELASLTKNSKTFTYAYNDSGIRTSKTVNGHTNAIYLSGDAIVRENPTGNISLTYLYDESGTRYGFLYKNGSTSSYYYYVYNGQGDVTEIVDSNGNKVAQYTYNAWGLPLSVKDGSGNAVSATNTTHIANLNPFRYRGYYYDNESGFYYLQSRYYDPQTGRFINADSMLISGTTVGSQNMFSYCQNNPINRSDSTGHWFGLDDLIAGVVGAAVGVGSQFVSDVAYSICTGEWQFSNWETYVGSGIGGAIGGVTSLYAGPVVGAAVGSGTSSLIGQGLENLTGSNRRSASEIARNTVVDTAIGALSAKFVPLKCSGITSGRNSMSAIYKSGLTKLKNKTASKMSMKTIGKGVASELIGGLPGSAAAGAKAFTLDSIDSYQRTQNGLPSGQLYWCAG